MHPSINPRCFKTLFEASHLIDLGFAVFPLAPLSKVPLLPTPWPELATRDKARLFSWWLDEPYINIGVVAGEDWLLVDIDRKKGVDGLKTIGHLVDWDNTPWVETPNGGFHVYYRNTAGVPAGKLAGVDIQAGNHYVVSPGSVIPGPPWEIEPRKYRWGNRAEAARPPWEEVLRPPWEEVLRPPGEPTGSPIGPPPLDLTLAMLAKPAVQAPVEAPSDQPDLLPWGKPVPFFDLKLAFQTFLATGEVTEYDSRSELIQGLTVQLYQLGFRDDEVLTALWDLEQVQSTALDHRQQIESKALDWLWYGCQKARVHRRLTVEEAFGPVASPASPPWAEASPLDTFSALQDDLSRIDAESDIRPFLQRAALLGLDALDKETLCKQVANQSGFGLPAIRTKLAELEKEARKAGRAGGKTSGPRWKHTAGEEGRPLGTLENLQALLDHKGATIRHNLMDHRLYMEHPSILDTSEDRLNNQITTVRSWAAEHRLPVEPVAEQLVKLAQEYEYHPFAEWVESKPWDGTSRLGTLLETIQVAPGRETQRDTLVPKWLLSMIASVWGYGNRPPRGVLTFIGPQQTGKTTWLHYLVPKGMYHQGHILRPENRDSAVKGLRYLLVELGEIGSTFRAADIEALKAYIGQRTDVYRLPYARDESTWQRRTVFAASANGTEILHDRTGNTRWWTLPVSGFNLDLMEAWYADGWGYNLQQLWAEVLLMYRRGDSWDLNDHELSLLDQSQIAHLEHSAVEEALMDLYAWEEKIPDGGYKNPKTLTQIKQDLGMTRMTHVEGRQLKDLLRRLTGQIEPKVQRLQLATTEGSLVDTYTRSSRVGRYWYVPPMAI